MAEALSPRRYIDLLAAALLELDLRIVVRGCLVTAKNPMALSQDVLLREAGEGLTWCWVWRPPRPADPDAPVGEPEIEPICPADDIDRAARLIAKVVSGRNEEPADV